MKEGYFNFSGGALGSDSEWDRIGRLCGFNNHFHFYHGSKTPLGNIELTEEELEEGFENVLKANLILKRNPYNYKSLLGRNWFQVKNATTIYAIGSFKKVKDRIEVKGGTGWAVQMAIDNCKSIFVFDQEESEEWKTYNYVTKSWISNEGQTPSLSLYYAGIGTRNINDLGITAIEKVYLKTMKQWI